MLHVTCFMLQSLKNLYHLYQATIGNIYYHYPSQKLKVIGVTGTDGKTTTTHLIYHILKSAGKKVSLISSIYAYIGGQTFDTGFHVTTPDVFPLQKFLKKSADYGDEFFVLETTSHALSQNRVARIKYVAGVLTNVTHEHLDFHKTYEAYLGSKLLLLKKAPIAVVNADDDSFVFVKRLLHRKFYTYALKSPADFRLDLGKILGADMADFNKYNYLAAYTVCRLLGISEEVIISALKSFKLPSGRLEVVYDKNFTAIIDFAHTPNAIKNVLAAVKKHYSARQGRIIHVFGSAGLRDSSKRPLMGEASAVYSDNIIITEEDYRSENPQVIANQIAEGIIKKGKKYEVELDREKAIAKAVRMAKKSDVIILTGKGHEKSLSRGKKEFPWNEKEMLLRALKKYKYI